MKQERNIARRTFLAAAGVSLVNVGLPGIFVRIADAEQDVLSASTRPDGRLRLPPGQTAVERIRPMGGTPGTATIADWSLRIHGEVEKAVVLSYQDLLDLEQVQITCDIHCVTGWTLLDSQWSGVRLSTILNRVKPRRGGSFIIFEAAAGYTTNVPISEAANEDVILAHSFFGEKLPRAHGAPVRVVVPDRYLYKSAKWLEAIKISSRDEPGYYESLGYSNSADPWKQERFQ